MSGILWGIFASALGVINTDVYQRALSVAVWYGAGPFFRAFFMNGLCILPIGVLLVLFPRLAGTGFSPFADSWILIAAVVSVSVSGIVSGIMTQYAYANEKMSVLAPFSETGRILTILLGFVLFSETRTVTFVSALFAGFAILFGSLDLKDFRVNRYSATLAASWTLRAFVAICSTWIVSRVSPIPFMFADVTFATAAVFILAFREWFPNVPKNAYLRMGKWFFLDDAIWFVSYLISLFLLKELGVVSTSLLGMVSMIGAVAYGSFFLGERPARKTVILTVFVAGCVIVGSIA